MLETLQYIVVPFITRLLTTKEQQLADYSLHDLIVF